MVPQTLIKYTVDEIYEQRGSLKGNWNEKDACNRKETVEMTVRYNQERGLGKHLENKNHSALNIVD